MQIIHVASELAPVAKVGGLADVLHGLSRMQLALGHTVEVIIPKYETLNLKFIQQLKVIDNDLVSQFDQKWHSNRVWSGIVDSIPVILLEPTDPKDYFDRNQIYGFSDDTERFIYFSLLALEYILKWKKETDIIHLHDWHAALIAPLLKSRGKEINAKSVLTIHNLIYQGICDENTLEKSGYKNEKLKEGDRFNLLKGGIVFADHITTVSRSYAEEILCCHESGLPHVLKKYEHKFHGILNGIDYDFWNPEKDPFLPHHFSPKNRRGKEKVKALLRKRFSLVDENAPIVAGITRLTHQKGPELLKAALLRTLERGGQFILLGTPLEDETGQSFYMLKKKLNGVAHVHLELAYDEELSHLVYGGSDLILVPSLFEPCGLTQLIAMRYGAIPLVRQTGGLADTVVEGVNGFTFLPATIEALNETIDRALNLWFTDPKKWEEIVDNGMRADFSWKRPAEEYLHLYNKLCTASLVSG